MKSRKLRSLAPGLVLMLAGVVLLAFFLLATGYSPELGAAPDEAQLGRLFRQAQREMRQGEPAAAEKTLLTILESAPYHFNAHYTLGRLYQRSNPRAALQHLTEARKIRPGSYRVHYRLGLVLERQGRLLEAAEAYRQAIRLNARHYAANERLRAILRRLRSEQTLVERAAEQFWVNPNLATLTHYGRIVMENSPAKQALWEFEAARDKIPGLPEINLWVARANRRLGSLNGEIEAYRTYLKGNGNADGVRLTLLDRMVEGWQFRRAAQPVALLEQRVEQNRLGAREAARFFFLRSRLELARGRAADAGTLLLEAGRRGHDPGEISSEFRRGLSLYPENGALWVANARWLSVTGELGASADAYQQAARLDPGLVPEARAALEAIAAKPAFAAAASLALGEMALAAGEVDHAEEFLRRVPPGQREDRRASLLLGLIHQKRGEVDQAIAALTRYLFSYEDRVGVAFARGNALWEMGQRQAAVAFWRKRLRQMEAYPWALGRIADYHQHQGQTARELEVRELLSRAAPQNLPNRIRLGDLYDQAGREKDATAEWEQVVAHKTGDFDLLVRLGRAYMARGQVDQGAEAFHRAAQIDSLQPPAARMLALHLLREQRFADALLIVEDVYRADPNDPEVARVLPDLVLNAPAPPDLQLAAARFAEEGGRRETAIDILAQLVADHADAEEGRFMLAGLYLKAGAPEEAETTLLAGTTVAAITDPARLQMVADAQARLGKEEALTGTLLRLRALSSDDPGRDRKLGLLLARFGRPDEALPLLREALNQNGSDRHLLVPLAKAELAVKQHQSAINHLEQALGLNPDDGEVRSLLIGTLLAQRQWKQLAPHLEFWVATHPQDARARYNLVTAYLREFQTARARPHFEALRETDPRMAALLARYFPEPPPAPAPAEPKPNGAGK